MNIWCISYMIEATALMKPNSFRRLVNTFSKLPGSSMHRYILFHYIRYYSLNIFVMGRLKSDDIVTCTRNAERIRLCSTIPHNWSVWNLIPHVHLTMPCHASLNQHYLITLFRTQYRNTRIAYLKHLVLPNTLPGCIDNFHYPVFFTLFCCPSFATFTPAVHIKS